MINKIKTWVIESAVIQLIVRVSKRIRVSVSHDISLYTVITFTKKELEDNDLMSESKSVAFNFTMATFPGIIFLFTAIAYIPGIDEESMLAFFKSILPAGQQDTEGFNQTVVSVISEVLGSKNKDWLNFGFFTALFLSTNGMVSLIAAFNKCYHTREKRGFLQVRIVALVLTLMLTVVLVFGVVTLIFGTPILDWLGEHHLITKGIHDYLVGLKTVEYAIFSFLFLVAISMIYYWAPSVSSRWRFFSLGAIIATLLSIVLSSIFSYYVNNFGAYNKLYGSIGTLIGFMVWIQAISLILLLGFEINAGMDKAKRFLARELKNQD